MIFHRLLLTISTLVILINFKCYSSYLKALKTCIRMQENNKNYILGNVVPGNKIFHKVPYTGLNFEEKYNIKHDIYFDKKPLNEFIKPIKKFEQKLINGKS